MAANTTASIQLTANHGALASGLRAAANLVNAFAKGTRAALAGVAAAPGGALINIGKSAAVLGQFAVAKRGLDALVDMGRGVFGFERKLTRFGIATRMSAEGLSELRREARATSTQTGIDAEVVLDSARAYVDLAGAQNTSIEKMKILARAGQASEAEGKDLAGMMYQLTRSMKVADDQMEDTMGGLINQAKDGAIEAKQMAAEFSGMMPIFARFGITGREGAIQLGAMYQVTRDGFDSAAQASTGMIRLMSAMQRHASRLKKWDIEVFKPGSKKELRDMSDILGQIKKSPMSKDIEATIKALGRSEAWRTLELLQEAPDRLRALEEAGRANGVVTKDLATFAESASGRMDIAFEKMKNAFADALTPERIDQIVSGINSIANAFPAIMRAIAATSELFGAFLHKIKQGEQMLGIGDSKYSYSDSDNAILEEERAHNLVAPVDPELRKRADAVRNKKANYDKAMGEITDLESDFGPTDASIKKAIEYGRSWYGTGKKMPGDGVGITYLKAHEKEISTARYKRLEAELQAEEEKGMTPYARTQRRYQMAEAEDKIKEAEAQKLFNEHVKPMVQAAVRDLGRLFGDAVKNRPTEVKIDGNPVAKAGGNATDRRRK